MFDVLTPLGVFILNAFLLDVFLLDVLVLDVLLPAYMPTTKTGEPPRLKGSLIHVPNKQREPLDTIDMVPDTNPLVNGMNSAQPEAVVRVIARREAEDMLGQAPVVPRVG